MYMNEDVVNLPQCDPKRDQTEQGVSQRIA
jgi:hypothetical protein